MSAKAIRNKGDFFPGFVYSAQSISAFRLYLGVFIISLKEGNIVRFDAGAKQDEFREWLKKHGIRAV